MIFTRSWSWLDGWLRTPARPFFLTPRTRIPHSGQAQVRLLHNRPLHSVDERFLSYSIDISVLAGGFWWEGTNATRKGLGTLRIPPLNLHNAKLDLLVQKLGPAYLRVGGSESDKLHYFQAPENEPDSLLLTQKMWDDLHAFKERNGLLLAFTFKYGLFKRKLHGKWHASELEALLRHSRNNNQRIEVCELGNELNAYWAFHGITAQPRARHLAQDYHEFAATIRAYLPEAKIIGPGSAFWPKLGETIKPFSNISRRFLEACKSRNTALDIVDWHYYPFQSLRSPVRTRTARTASFLKPHALNDYQKYAQHMRLLRDEFYPEATLWTGETGSAQCGGQPKISDRFTSCFWWADQLGLGALNQQSVMIRQSLVGGDYGMIDRLTLKPRPDYWLAWLWKQLMGRNVYAVETSHHLLRAYCHSSVDGKAKTLLLINLSGRTIKITTEGLGSVLRQYAVTAKRMRSKKVRINGVKARFQKGQFSLDSFATYEVNYTLAGHSINFWLLEP